MLNKLLLQMKKILFLIPAFLLAFQISKAQTEKGSQTLGVNADFVYQKSSHASSGSDNLISKNTSWGIGPSYSYFIADKLDIGASLGYSHINLDNSTQSYPSTQHQNDYSASVFLRKYFMYNDKFGIRTGPYVGYDRYNTKSTYPDNGNVGDNSSKTDTYNAGINLGFVYYPSKNIGFAANLANLSYSHSKTNTGASGHDSADNVNLNFISNNLGLSVFYVFGGK